jgi:hypothetical protein
MSFPIYCSLNILPGCITLYEPITGTDDKCTRVLLEEGNRPLTRPTCRWETDIKIHLHDTGSRGEHWFCTTGKKEKYRLMNIHIQHNGGNVRRTGQYWHIKAASTESVEDSYVCSIHFIPPKIRTHAWCKCMQHLGGGTWRKNTSWEN